MGAWAAEYFETHHAPSPKDLERVFDGFAPDPHGVKSSDGNFLEYHDYNFSGSTVKIGPAIYVAQGCYWMDNSTCGFLVVARARNGHFQALWNIKDLAEKHFAQRDEIGRWVFLVRLAYYNGPLAIKEVLPLPPAANGHARFLVDAYQSAEGGTAPAQLSIWEWDGAEAKPLLVKAYQYARDYRSFHFDGRTIRIATKEELQILHACGMCPEPRAVWTIRITPDGVRDLGRWFQDPEIEWADELLARIDKGKETNDLAAASVVTAVKNYIKKELAEDAVRESSLGKDFTWGMLEGCRIVSRGRQGAFVVSVDVGQLRFSYVMRMGKPYFTKVQITDRI